MSTTTFDEQVQDVLDAEPELPIASIDELRGAIPFAEARVNLPEIGKAVIVRSLSAHKRAMLMNGLLDNDGNVRSIPELQARMFAASVVNPVVSVEDARELARTWPAPVWDRVTAKVDELSPKPQEVRRAAAREFPDAED
jgi:hypothetical protein